jgi:hypothetical protein
MSDPKTKSQSQITTLDNEPSQAEIQAKVANVAMATPGEGMSGKMEIVTIHSSSEDGGSDAVFLSHNGYAYQVPRDQPFKMPTEVVQILRDAKVTSYKPGPGGAVTEKQMPRFAFSAQPA